MMHALPLLAILTCFPRIDCSSNLPSYLRNQGSQDDHSAEYLINSVVKGDFKEVLRLVQSNSSFANAQDSEKTALTYAVQKGDVRMVRLLLQYGANTNSYVEMSLAFPPSFWAVDTNNTEILKLLLEYCADPNVQHEFERGETRSLRGAAELKQNLKMVELIDGEL
ncbi:ankyrin repeat domain-containing protein 49-like [Macrobrachium rosenbergii]|uniref:ankyrin repeat domain-containing protein 49-like n=1 Tax=Macrobrachium rosenbergii TaxID=79674 RepID=UPI0034D7A7DF